MIYGYARVSTDAQDLAIQLDTLRAADCEKVSHGRRRGQRRPASAQAPDARALAAIVQRSAMIKSPGGYLRNLTGKARAGKFSAWPMLMALWRLQQGYTKQE